METVYQVANILQLGGTVLFIGLCLTLFQIWWPSYKEALIHMWEGGFVATVIRHEIWTPRQWLLVGIMSSFIAAISDQIYWGITWTVVLFDADLGAEMIEAGPASNLVFRQAMGCWAAYCHIVGAKMSTDSDIPVPLKTYSLAALGVVILLTLEAYL